MKTPYEFPGGRGTECACLPRPADPAPPPMPSFVLRYEDRWFGVEKRVAFEAADVTAALAMMEHEPIGSWAELTMDGQLVCRRGRIPGGDTDYWTVD